MPYIGKNPSNIRRSITEKNTFTGDGSTTTFDVSSNIPAGSGNDIQVFVNDVRQFDTTDYTVGLDGSNRLRRITFTSAPTNGHAIVILNPGVFDSQITTVTDGAITSAKIADGTIVNADINNSAAIVDTKLDTISTVGKVNVNALSAPGSGSVFLAGDGSFKAIDTSQQDTNALNISLLGFKMAVNEGLTVFNLVDGVVDEFNDESGTDEAEGSNDTYCGNGDYYSNLVLGCATPISAGFAIALVTEPDTSTAQTNPAHQTGTYGSFTVPVGLTALTIKTWGAGGSGGFGDPGSPVGGGGGYASGVATVSPGQSLEIIVGEGARGQVDGGSEGGLGGVHPQQSVPQNNLKGGGYGPYGSGGGLSGVTDGTSLPSASTPNLLIIAGAGGGGGGHNNAQGPGGAGGGSQGGTGTGILAGGGGTQSQGGPSPNNTGGFLYGATTNNGGGGGGAGYYGGGAGGTTPGEHAGGGGGSSYISSPLLSSGSTNSGTANTSGGSPQPEYPGLPNPAFGSIGQGGEGPPGPGGNGESGGDGYVLLTGTSVPTSIASTTIVSQGFTATSEASTARIVVFEEDVDTPTINTDIIASISRDGGTTFTNATLTDSGYVTGSSGQRILTGQATISGQPTGQTMRWKLALANNEVRIHGVSLQWA